MIAKFLLCTIAALSVATLIYVARNSGELLVSRNYMAAYAGFPALILLLAFAGFWWRKRRTEILIVLLSIGASLWLAEGWLIVTEPTTNNTIERIKIAAAAANAAGRTMDTRVQTQVIRDLREAGKDAYPTFSPTSFLFDSHNDGADFPPMDINGRKILPLGNVARTQSVYCNESGDWLVFPSDRFGFNNPDGLWDGSKMDVAVVGDSFAQGACVGVGENAIDLLRKHIPMTINLGVGGTGPLLQLGILKEFGPPLRPTTVVWLFYEGNDLHVNLSTERRFDLLRRYLEKNFQQGLFSTAPEADRFVRGYIDSHFEKSVRRDTDTRARAFSLAQTLKLLRLRDRLGLTACPSRAQDFGLLESIYSEGRRLVEGWGGRLLVMYIPAWGGACDLFDPSIGDASWIRRRVRHATQAAGLPFFDAGIRTANPRSYYFYPGSHFNQEGYAQLAEKIEQAIAQVRADIRP